jgi:hypothetical protein
MSLTPPPLRSGSVPAQEFSHGGHGGSEAAPPKPLPKPPSRTRVSRFLRQVSVGRAQQAVSLITVNALVLVLVLA